MRTEDPEGHEPSPPIRPDDDLDLEMDPIEPTFGERLRSRFTGGDGNAGEGEPRSPLHAAVTAATAEALARFDPTGLAEIGGGAEDFEDEADAIAARTIEHAQSAEDTQTIVREVLDDHHGADERSEVPDIADAVWLAYEGARTEADQAGGETA